MLIITLYILWIHSAVAYDDDKSTFSCRSTVTTVAHLVLYHQ